MSPLWSAAEAASATAGASAGEWLARGVSIDTRTLVPGDLFVALLGPNRDGHDFVGDAFLRGAAAAVVARDIFPENPLLLRVPDTFEALKGLAAAARERSRAKIVAVTGSVGKTGTKEALALLLSACGATAASEGSLNNHWGVPLSLARLPRVSCFGVFELGMNHEGEIRRLSRLVRPHVALVTTVDAVHLGYFSSLDAIAEAKAEIFEGLERGGTAVLNRDNPYYERLRERARAAGAREVIAFGADPRAQVRLLDCVVAERESTVEASLAGIVLRYRLPLAGRHWVVNSLAALAAALAVGADPQMAGAAFSRLKAPPGRGRRYDLPWRRGILSVIDESYNASPSAMRAALFVLARSAPGEGGRRVAILGDMLELGAAAPRLHRELLEPIEEGRVDRVFLVGSAMAALDEVLPAGKRGGLWSTVEEAIPSLLSDLRPGDVVTVKASHGVRADRIVEKLIEEGREGET
jgi:UDP-N-acetylmuramoyl-tripeptide--D-alanyl-D-alanine ligase